MIYTITLCYNNPKVVEESINRYYELCYNKPDVHYILNDCYPLHKEELKETLKKLSDKYGCIILESDTNLGIVEGLLFVMKEITEPKNEDIFIFYDSNSYPITKNFDKAIVDSYKNPEIAISSLMGKVENLDKKDIITDSITNLKYCYYNTESRSTITSFIYRAYILVNLKNSFHMFSKTYGDNVNFTNNIRKYGEINNLKMIYLIDYNENPFYFTNNKLEDMEYISYKSFILNIKPKDHISFEDYLKTDYSKYISNYSTNVNKEIFYFTGITEF